MLFYFHFILKNCLLTILSTKTCLLVARLLALITKTSLALLIVKRYGNDCFLLVRWPTFVAYWVSASKFYSNLYSRYFIYVCCFLYKLDRFIHNFLFSQFLIISLVIPFRRIIVYIKSIAPPPKLIISFLFSFVRFFIIHTDICMVFGHFKST